MRSIVFLLSILMVSYVFNSSCEGVNKDSGDDCKKLDTETKSNHCCLEISKFGGTTNKECVEISNELYEKIGEYLDTTRKGLASGYEYDIDCGCSYLSISLLSLLLFFPLLLDFLLFLSSSETYPLLSLFS